MALYGKWLLGMGIPTQSRWDSSWLLLGRGWPHRTLPEHTSRNRKGTLNMLIYLLFEAGKGSSGDLALRKGKAAKQSHHRIQALGRIASSQALPWLTLKHKRRAMKSHVQATGASAWKSLFKKTARKHWSKTFDKKTKSQTNMTLFLTSSIMKTQLIQQDWISSTSKQHKKPTSFVLWRGEFPAPQKSALITGTGIAMISFRHDFHGMLLTWCTGATFDKKTRGLTLPETSWN